MRQTRPPMFTVVTSIPAPCFPFLALFLLPQGPPAQHAPAPPAFSASTALVASAM